MIDWQRIIDKHGSIVWQTAYRLLGNHADAADCFQETFICAVELLGREPVRNFPALLARLATARAIDRLRERIRQAKIHVSELDLAAVANGRGGPEKQAQINELIVKLRTALTKLPAQEAQAFCLRHINGMSYHEIGKMLGIGTSNAGVLIHRAKKKLRNSFEKPSNSKNRGVL